jgi:5-methylcytosine-specific restriction endonuclease McrA
MPKRTGRPWQRRKAAVIRRDAGICHICGQPGADSADHIEPWSISRDDRMSNLAAVHHNVPPHCNRIRGDRDIETARRTVTAHLDDPSSSWTW